jgi:hypothetical protein
MQSHRHQALVETYANTLPHLLAASTATFTRLPMREAHVATTHRSKSPPKIPMPWRALRTVHVRRDRCGMVVGILLMHTVLLVTGCAKHGQLYSPAWPAFVQVPWEDPPPPPPHPAIASLPTEREWGQWKEVTTPRSVCRGKGKARRCKKVPPTAVDVGNAKSLVTPTIAHNKHGTSSDIHYEIDLDTSRTYTVLTSPSEPTYLFFPPGEVMGVDLLLNTQAWEISYGASTREPAERRAFLAVRPKAPDQSQRVLMVFESGFPLSLRFQSQERPGMLSVTWDAPARAKPPPPPSPETVPPVFNNATAYAGYTMTLEGNVQMPPPWFPTAVLDDGRNTLVKFRSIDGVPVPVVSAIQANGKPAVRQSRLYVRREHGAWMWMQGLSPAWVLQDSGGSIVKIVRQVPASIMEETHAQ